MALAARARGTAAQLLGKIETTIGTAPSGNWPKLPFYTLDLSASRPLVDDPVLSLGKGRNSSDPFADALTVKGSLVVPLDTGNIDTWLAMAMGTITTTGTGPHTDTYLAGNALSSWSLEKGMVDLADYWAYAGIYADGFTLQFTPTGPGKLTLPLMGLASAAKAGSTIGGTPTVATFAAIRNNAATFSIGGSVVGNLTDGTLTLAQGSEEIRTVRASGTDGAAAAIDQGLMSAKGALTLRYDDSTLDDLAIAGTANSIDIAFSITGGFTLTFTLPRAFLDRAGVPIAGPGGIEQKLNMTAAYDASATTVLKVTRTRA